MGTSKDKKQEPQTDQQKFVQRLAVYISGKDAENSIRLEMGDAHAKEWAEIRGLTPIHGYVSVDETASKLTAWLKAGL